MIDDRISGSDELPAMDASCGMGRHSGHQRSLPYSRKGAHRQTQFTPNGRPGRCGSLGGGEPRRAAPRFADSAPSKAPILLLLHAGSERIVRNRMVVPPHSPPHTHPDFIRYHVVCTTPCSSAQLHTIPCDFIRFRAIPYDSIRFRTMAVGGQNTLENRALRAE